MTSRKCIAFLVFLVSFLIAVLLHRFRVFDSVDFDFAPISKQDTLLHVIVSRFKEPLGHLGWLRHFNHTIYNRGEMLTPSESLVAFDVLDNVGRESFIYLNHIVRNYNSLADLNVFTQATQTWRKYSDRLFMVDVVALASRKINLSGYNDGFAFLSRTCLSVESGMSATEIRNGVPHEEVTDAVFERYPDLPLTISSVRERIKLLITNVFQAPYVDHPRFSPTGTLIVTREAIHRRSAEYYKKLARQLNDKNSPQDGYIFERVWPFIFLSNCSSTAEFHCLLPGVKPAC